MRDLVAVAATVEEEALRRYRWLAAEMRRRGERDTAAAFDTLVEEEQRHVTAIEAWARDLGEPVPEAREAFRWRLPTELGTTWEEAVQSSLLTPYRAYAIAVANEERAFAFYAYLAADAAEPKVARQAELLAQEELRHAAILRIWRRKAWRRERRDGAAPDRPQRAEASAAHLNHVIAEHEAEIAACHGLLAQRLDQLGDQESAKLLADLAREAAVAASGLCTAEACTADEPLGLLIAAQRPVERYCEVLEAAVLAAADDRVRQQAQQALEGAVSRLARLGRRIESLE